MGRNFHSVNSKSLLNRNIGERCGIGEKKGVKCFHLDVNVEKFPFGDNYFDAIFASEIIEQYN